MKGTQAGVSADTETGFCVLATHVCMCTISLCSCSRGQGWEGTLVPREPSEPAKTAVMLGHLALMKHCGVPVLLSPHRGPVKESCSTSPSIHREGGDLPEGLGDLARLCRACAIRPRPRTSQAHGSGSGGKRNGSESSHPASPDFSGI